MFPWNFGDMGLLENNPNPQNPEGKMNYCSLATQNEQNVNSKK